MPYKLKEWEKWDTEALHHFPHYCPNCGKPFTNAVVYWSDSSRPCSPENPPKGLGYDCYCDDCHWGGTIEPDADHDIVEFIPKPLKSSKYKRLK